MRRQTDVGKQRAQYFVDIRPSLILRAPHVGNHESVAFWVDDMGHQARWRATCVHHGLAHTRIELVELIFSRGCNGN